MVMKMRLNNKGFMMAEVVVVSVIICTILVTLYTGINRVSNAYNIRNKYYDINALYMALRVNLFLIDNGDINTYISNGKSIRVSSTDDITSFYKSGSDSSVGVYFSLYNKNSINSLANIYGVNVTFKDFITYLDGHLDFNEDYSYMIISEICNDRDDCNYYGLRVR